MFGKSSSTSSSSDYHSTLLTYLSNLLSVRDRTTIADALANTTPDLLSTAVRDMVDAWEPILRTLHQNLDIRVYMENSQQFMDDFLTCAKIKEGKPAPTVGEFAAMLNRQRPWLFEWLQSAGAKCPELAQEFRQWAKSSARMCMRSKQEQEFCDQVTKLWEGLAETRRAEIGGVLDKHADRLDSMKQSSRIRLQKVVDSMGSSTVTDALATAPSSSISSGANTAPTLSRTMKRLGLSRSNTMATPTPSSTTTTPGPGVFLLKAQALLDETPITSGTPLGHPRRGKDVADNGGSRGMSAGSVRINVEQDTDVSLGSMNAWDGNGIAQVVEALGADFLKLLENFSIDRTASLAP